MQQIQVPTGAAAAYLVAHGAVVSAFFLVRGNRRRASLCWRRSRTAARMLREHQPANIITATLRNME